MPPANEERPVERFSPPVESQGPPLAEVDYLKSLGFTVFPCLNAPGDKDHKHPKTKGSWKTEPQGGWPFGANDLIAVAMPPDTIAIDIDSREEFEKNEFFLPQTVTQFTQREGGVHYFYRTDGRAARQQNESKRLGYDTRVGGKGYVIAWNPLGWTDPSEWSEAPEWVYEPAVERGQPTAAPQTAEDLSNPPEGRHSLALNWLGKMKNMDFGEDAMLAALIMENRRRGWELDDADLRRLVATTRGWTRAEFSNPALAYVIGQAAGDAPAPAPEPEVEAPENSAPPVKWPAPPDAKAYHGVMGDIVRTIAPYTEADPIALLGTGLTIFGVLAGGETEFYESGRHSANIFACLVGQTSSGRKGSAFGAMKGIFDAIEHEWTNRMITGLGSGEGLIARLRDQTDPRTLIYEGEFGALLTAMAREGSTLGSAVRNAWDGYPIGRHVVSQKASGQVDNHHIGILGNITDIELKKKLSPEDLSNGFANRFLWLAVRRQKLVPITEDFSQRAQPYFVTVRRALDLAEIGGTAHFSPEAKVYWTMLYRDRESKPRVGIHADVTTRAQPYIARLALLYALLDETLIIDIEHIQAAEALWDYADRSALYIFGNSTGNRKADAMLAFLAEEGGTAPAREAGRAVSIREGAELNETIDFLDQIGRVRVFYLSRPSNEGGRKRKMLELRAIVANAQLSEG